MKKIIFLDFDGVLNTEYNQNLLMYHGKSWEDKYGAFFDPETVAELDTGFATATLHPDQSV